jgi:TP901 family phage tail tape measure protein
MAQKVVWTFIAKDKFSRIAAKIKKQTGAMNAKFKKLNTTMKKTSKRLKAIGGSMKYASAAAAVLVGTSLKAFGNMEQGLTNVYTLMNQKEFEKFGGRVKELATESLTKFGFSTEEATGALFDTISALGTSTMTLDAFQAAQKLAIGGNADLKISSLGVARVMVAYKDDMLDATDVANGFFAAQKVGITDVQKLALNIGKVAKNASGIGISYQELLATTAILTKSFSTEISVTSFKALIKSIVGAKGEAAAMLTSAGVPTTVLGVEDIGWTETLRRLAKLGDKSKDDLLKAIPAMEAYDAAAALNVDAVEEMAAAVHTMKLDQLTAAYEMQMKTFNRSTAIAKGNIVALGAEIGEQLAPAFMALGEFLGTITEYFRSLSDTQKKWIAWLLVTVAVLAAVFVAAAGIVAIFGTAFTVVAAAVAGVFTAIVGGITAFLLTTTGLVVLVLAMIGLAIYTWWDEIKAFASSVGRFFGFGEDPVDLTKTADTTNTTKVEAELKVEVPKEANASLKQKITGGSGPQLGYIMMVQE